VAVSIYSGQISQAINGNYLWGKIQQTDSFIVRFLDLIKPFTPLLPEVAAPESKVPFNQKMMWTGVVDISGCAASSPGC
jgi:hypothetical protein